MKRISIRIRRDGEKKPEQVLATDLVDGSFDALALVPPDVCQDFTEQIQDSVVVGYAERESAWWSFSVESVKGGEQ